MLVAASEWHAFRLLPEATRNQFPSHFHVVTMDSACLHARSLYEFFLTPKKNSRPDTAYAERDFGVTLKPTKVSSTYIDSLNKRLFHVDLYRPVPVKKVGGSVKKVKTDVNTRVVEIATDVLTLWDEFAGRVGKFPTALKTARKKAIADAAQAATSICGAARVFQ